MLNENESLVKFMEADLMLVKKRDPAFVSHLNTFLYMKGFSGVCMARIAQFLYR